MAAEMAVLGVVGTAVGPDGMEEVAIQVAGVRMALVRGGITLALAGTGVAATGTAVAGMVGAVAGIMVVTAAVGELAPR